MRKILFIAAHRFNRSPSQRFRFEQYFSFLESNGFECELSYLINEKDDKIFYAHGNFFNKLMLLFKSCITRYRDIKKCRTADIVFVQREALMIGSVWFEKKFRNTHAKFVFDFDDSIWLTDTSAGNKKWEWLKDPSKTKKIIQMADLVFAGNKYLGEYASRFNKNVTLIPTTVDTNTFRPDEKQRNSQVITIGWSGSPTTIKHFQSILPVLKKIKEIFKEKVDFIVVGDEKFFDAGLNIKGIAWNSENEIERLNRIHIGIMPLPDDKWAAGKCGLKGLTYMALEIPTIMSPVGVNREIIQHGVNGFLAQTDEEWFKILSDLIQHPEKRKQIGIQGRKTVIDRYSVKSQAPKYLNAFQQLLAEKN